MANRKSTKNRATPRRSGPRFGTAAIMGKGLTQETKVEMKSVPLGLLVESKNNPRRDFNEAALTELAGSIKAQGILEPILVRKKAPKYEIVAGARRFRAAKKAGLKNVPVLIRDMTDEQALEAQVIENLQREDLSALEEAAGFSLLMKHAGYKPGEIAEKIGKSIRYVYNRLELIKLIARAKKLLEERRITASHAELLTRLQPEAQDQVLKWGCRGNDGVESVREFGWYIGNHIYRDLQGVPWKLDDVTLVKEAGPCSSCPKRAGNSPTLPPNAKKSTCLDAKCFSGKFGAHISNQMDALEKKGFKVRKISGQYSVPGGVLPGRGWSSSMRDPPKPSPAPAPPVGTVESSEDTRPPFPLSPWR